MNFRICFSLWFSFLFIYFLFFPSLTFAVRPYLVTEDAIPVERGKSRLEGGLSFIRFDSDDRRIPFVLDFTQGVINNLDFGIQVPVIFKSGSDSSDGLGNITVKSKLRFVKGREANPLSLSSQLFIKFPSCDKDKNLSPDCTGETDVGFVGIASKEFYPIMVHLNIGYIFIGNPSGINFDDVFRYSLVFDYLTVFDPLRFFGEFAGETQRNPNEPTDPIAIRVGTLYEFFQGFSADGSFDFGLTEVSPEIGLNIGVTYSF